MKVGELISKLQKFPHETVVIPPFDIFRRQNGGSLRWLEEVADLEVAKLRVKELADLVPGEYFVFSLGAGRRFDLKQGETTRTMEKSA